MLLSTFVTGEPRSMMLAVPHLENSLPTSETSVEENTSTSLRARDNTPVSAGQSRFIRLRVERP